VIKSSGNREKLYAVLEVGQQSCGIASALTSLGTLQMHNIAQFYFKNYIVTCKTWNLFESNFAHSR
jgi:hypothetical protein